MSDVRYVPSSRLLTSQTSYCVKATIGDIGTPEPIQLSLDDLGPYVRGMEYLIEVIQELSLVRTLQGVMEIVRHAARNLTEADGASFVLRDQDRCFYADEDSIEPLWKGQRFPMKVCIGGWAMLNQAAAIITDVYGDERIPHEAYRPTFVKSLVMTPIRTREPIGAIGVYWAKRHPPTPVEVRLLQALADSTAIAMENVQIYDQLEQRVRDRTYELQVANGKLQQEIRERQAAEAMVRRLSMTDELTGLHNRRSFLLLAGDELKEAQASRRDRDLLFIDLDGLKAINDQCGHEMGDDAIVQAARQLQIAFPQTDYIARLGGDEFVILLDRDTTPHLSDSASINVYLQACLTAFNQSHHKPYRLAMSVGVEHWSWQDNTPLGQLIAQADNKMYTHKRQRRAERCDRSAEAA